MSMRRRLLAAWLLLRRRLRRLRVRMPARTTRRIFGVSLSGILILFAGFVLLDRTPAFLIESKVRKLEDQGHHLALQILLFQNRPIAIQGESGSIYSIGPPPYGDPALIGPVGSGGVLAFFESLTAEPMPLPDSDNLHALLAQLPLTTPLHVQLHDPEFQLIADARHERFVSDSLGDSTAAYRLLARAGRALESVLLAPFADALARLRARMASPVLQDDIAYRVVDDVGGDLPRPQAGEEDKGLAVLAIAPESPMRLSVTLPIVQVQRIEGYLTVSELPGEIDPLLRQANLRLLWVALLSLVVCLVLSAWLARIIARPLAALAAHAQAIRLSGQAGRLADSWPHSAGRRDEIGQLSEALAGLTRSLTRRSERTREFADIVAHELRQPVYSIGATAEVLRENLERSRTDGENGPLDAKLEKGLPIITNAAARMNTLVTDISNFAKLDPTLAQKPLSEFDICERARAVLEEMRASAAERGVTLAARLPPRPVAAVGEQQHLERAMINLVDNAVSFSPPGGTVTLGVAALPGRARITVDDEGPGIPPDRREKVFDALYKERGEEQDRDAHSGLGLSIVRDVVAHAGGSVWVEDAPSRPDGGAGARVAIELRSSFDGRVPSLSPA